MHDATKQMSGDSKVDVATHNGDGKRENEKQLRTRGFAKTSVVDIVVPPTSVSRTRVKTNTESGWYT